MTIQKRRTDLGWTQEQLALNAGLSVRTVQRVENGTTPTLETLKCLAATFDVPIVELTKDNEMHNTPLTGNTKTNLDPNEQQALDYVESLKIFHMNWITAAIVFPCLVALNYYVSPNSWWVIAVVLGWGLAIGLHALFVFDAFKLLGADWEQKQFQKRMQQLKR
jgi:transcriptional regulator with XRE-family HTH domain